MLNTMTLQFNRSELDARENLLRSRGTRKDLTATLFSAINV